MNTRRFYSILVAALILGSFLVQGQKTDKRVVCPGKGERCAYVKILGVKIWSKKDKGAPGIIITEIKEDEN